MPENLKMPPRVPITTAPTVSQIGKWEECLRLYEQINDRVFAIGLLSECLNARAEYAASNQLTLNLPGALEAEKKRVLLEAGFSQVSKAVLGVQRWEYGLRWRDGDFDILAPSATMGALFIPIAIGALIIAGCFATLYHIGKSSDELLIDYQKLNRAADNALCFNPDSDLCKGWQVVKEQQQITEKESFADSLKGGLSKGITAALAIVGGMLALSLWRK